MQRPGTAPHTHSLLSSPPTATLPAAVGCCTTWSTCQHGPRPSKTCREEECLRSPIVKVVGSDGWITSMASYKGIVRLSADHGVALARERKA